MVAAAARAGNVKHFQLSLCIPHEGVVNKVAVVVLEASHNDSKCIYVGSARPITPLRTVARARVGTIPRRKLPLGAAQESVEGIVRVDVDAYNRSLEINPSWSGAESGPAWNIEARKLSLGTPQKCVAESVRVRIGSRDSPRSLMLFGYVPL